MDEKKERIIKIIRIGVALTIALFALFLVNEEHFDIAGYVINIFMNVIAWIILGYDMVFEVIEHFKEREDIINEELLMVLASGGAFSLLAFHQNECFEAVMILLFFQIGELFEDYAHDKTKDVLREASELRSKVAHKKEGENEVNIDPKDIVQGDILVIHRGEILPTDGMILEGEGRINAASLTGESLPIRVILGDAVAAGTILEEGLLTIQATADYENNTVAKILKMIEEGEEHKSKVTRFVDKFASIYTPIVFVISILIAIIPPLFLGISDGSVWSTWIYHGLCVLVISCPCSIVASVPLAYFAGMGLAGKKGILIKSAEVFDRLNNMKVVYTDKTGTLTKGVFQINVVRAYSISEEELIALAKRAEQHSSHPIAKAIQAYAGPVSDIVIENFEERPGEGIYFISKKDRYFIGKKAYLEAQGIMVQEKISSGTAVFFGKNDTYLGVIFLGDEIKENASALVKYLHKMHHKIYLLSGDRKENVAELAKALALDGYEGDCTVARKQEAILEAKKENPEGVVFMGDGINDAASISESDLGIAMGKYGSDLAINSADVIIMTDNPASLVSAHRIARSVRRQSIFNIVLSVTAKLSIMAGSIFIPGFPLIIAVASDTGLLLICVVLSISIFLRKKL